MAAPLATKDYRLLPGRLRISVCGLHRNQHFADFFTSQLHKTAGITAVTANRLTGKALIYFDEKVLNFEDLQDSIRRIQDKYFLKSNTAANQSPARTEIGTSARIDSSHVIYTAATGGVLAGLLVKRRLIGRSPLASSPHVFNLVALTTIVSGYPILRNGIAALLQKKRINCDLIIFLATLVLLAMRESLTGLSVLWIVHLSNLFQQVMQLKTQNSIREILAGKQQQAWLMANNQIQAVKISEIKNDDIVVAHSGERAVVDGEIIAGNATVNESAITGNCKLTTKQTGDRIFAGTAIQSGVVHIRSERVGRETLAAKAIAMVAAAPKARGSSTCTDDLYSNKLTVWTGLTAGLVFLLTRDLRHSLAVLLAGCPAAIALARNAALGTAVARAAANGIYIKDTHLLEATNYTDTVLFDKTGTLTTTLPEITEVVSFDRTFSQENILAIAASGNKSTEYPFACALVNAAEKHGLELLPSQGEYIAGYGVSAIIDGKQVMIGNQLMMTREKINPGMAKGRALRMEQHGNSVLYVAVERKLAGLIGVRDSLREESHEAVEQVRALGISNIGIISGDVPGVTKIVANELGIRDRWSNLLPEDKAKLVMQLQGKGKQVMIVGDGTNDSLALTASNVGIVMGGIGTDAAVNSAGIVVAGDDPRKVAETILLSRHTHEVVKQNIAIAAGLNVAGIALAVARLISPLTAGMLLNISTLGVIINSGRLLSAKKYGQGQKQKTTAVMERFFSRQSRDSAQIAVSECSASLAPNVMNSAINAVQADYYRSTGADTCDFLQTSPRFGLSRKDVEQRRRHLGRNEIAKAPLPSFGQLFFRQFKDLIVQVLLGAAGLTFFLGKVKDAMLTLGIVAANAILGVIQEKKAGKSIEALKRMSAPQAKIIREGKTIKVFAGELVPGDIISLEAGDRVPADARLLSTAQFEVEESSLTGETLPMKKDAEWLNSTELPLGDRRNMIYMGTSITRGRAIAVVTATGMATEMGKIAALIQQDQEEQTPLQRRLEELAKHLVYGCLAISGLVFLTGLMRGQPMLTMLQAAASLAVAAIPEGLTAIVIVALAMGVQRMSKRNIIIRKLSSIETLGCATVICSDKTGTLTQNQMTVREIYTVGNRWKVTGEGYSPIGEFSLENSKVIPANNPDLMLLLLTGHLCNNAKLVEGKSKNKAKVVPITKCHSEQWTVDGDPTEGALLAVAGKAGIRQQQPEYNHNRVKENPFDSERKKMSVVCAKAEEGLFLYAKGAPDRLLADCTHVINQGQIVPLDEATRRQIEQENERMANDALRVLACAYRNVSEDELGDGEGLEKNMVFCGLIGMIDPPRAEVPEAIIKCKKAGIKVVMITGDHPNTARAIADELGLFDQGCTVLLGQEIDKMSDDELDAVVDSVCVYARTAPHHKLRIVKALKAKGHIVAMTGDGVNDAPAVKFADIGIAMGQTGTEVTKEAASMTLADDNFATIVKAVEEGRSIYANIRKAIRYLVATNIGEVVLMFLAALMGMPAPLLPIQLLWINMIGDGLPAIALVNDPPAKNIMDQPPRTSNDSVFSGGLGYKVMTRGLIIGLASLVLFVWKVSSGSSLIAARTLMIAHLVISEFVHIFDCRIENHTGKVGLFSNKWLVGAVAVSMMMVAGIIHLPVLQSIFGTAALSAGDWLIALAAAGITSIVDITVVKALTTRQNAKVTPFNPVAAFAEV